MIRLNSAAYGIIKGISSSLLILLITLMIAYEKNNNVTNVFIHSVNKITLNEDNLVTMIKQYTSTDFLHRIKLTNGEIELQLHFGTMLKLVEHLDPLSKEYLNFYFNEVLNINKLTIFISVSSPDAIVYEIKMTKRDYEVGKEIEIKPLL